MRVPTVIQAARRARGSADGMELCDRHPGAWVGAQYRFTQRCRSGTEHNRGDEFDAPFARIDRMGPDCFDIYWMRHAGGRRAANGGGCMPA
jgi:hypothetical protein